MKRKSNPKFPSEFLKQVREACKYYDKPERIGRLPLASVALQAMLRKYPTHSTDGVGRGKALKSVIRINLDKLKPEEPCSREGEVYLCLYCHIHKRDPYTGVGIADVATYLKSHPRTPIPQATYYYRLKKEGIPQLSYFLTLYLAQQTTWIEPVPKTVAFVGREKELAYYRHQLETHRLAVIEGVGGVGKTTLAARLTESLSRPICWLTIRRGLNDTPTAILYAWAAFLAAHDSPQLWAFMRTTATEQRQLTDFFPLLRKGLAQVRPLFCLDNLEVLSNSAAWSLLEMVQATTSLLLISQRRPPLPRLGDYSPLAGLSLAEVQLFMQRHNVDLTTEQAETVTSYTLGNPRLLELWTAYIRLQALEPAITSLANLRDSPAATSFLATEIISTLTASQQRAARLLALSRRPLDGFLLQNPPPDLPPLSDFEIEAHDFSALHRLALIDDKLGDQWILSPFLSDYLSAQLMPAEAEASEETLLFHEWLARLYILQGNVLEAAYHTMQGQEPERAVLWLAEQQHLLIEQGQAAAMSRLLASIEAELLSQPVRQILHNLRGTLCKLLGDYDAAESEAREAAHEAMTVEGQADAERTRGELAKRRGNVWQAAEHYQHALRLLATKQATLEAWLHRDLAWAIMEQNDLDEAWDEAQRAQIALENTLGNIARRRGEIEQALHHFKQGAASAQKYGERRELARINNSLAVLYWRRGQSKQSSRQKHSPEQLQLIADDLKQAIVIYQENIKLTEEIGQLVGQAITYLNMGLCYADLGELNLSISQTKEALATFTTLGDNKGKMLAQLNLAESQLRVGQLKEAQQHAQAATDVDKALVAPGDYAEALRIYAEVLLAQGELTAALTAAQQALDELRTPGVTADSPDAFREPSYAKLICETLARIHSAGGKSAKAEKYTALAMRLQKGLGQ